MKIENEFTKFLSEMSRSYNRGSDDNIELKLFTVDELRWIGFYRMKVDDFIKRISPLEEKDINEFFNKHIVNLSTDMIDGFILEFSGGTIGEFIKRFKLTIIKNFLSAKMYNFVNEMKNPDIGFNF